ASADAAPLAPPPPPSAPDTRTDSVLASSPPDAGIDAGAPDAGPLDAGNDSDDEDQAVAAGEAALAATRTGAAPHRPAHPPVKPKKKGHHPK
ncbi:MAG TPA: hypothetical protein VNO21_23130, partial [Polyangiaceae bacterium]|nr:hypothetical protein [Polyangiaceae bacterium]